MGNGFVFPETATQGFPLGTTGPGEVERSQPQPEAALSPSLEDLQRFSQGLRRVNGYVSEEEMVKTFDRELGRCSVISFDIFDTLLVRFVEHPEDVFIHLADHAAFKAHTFVAPVSALRKTAEAQARHLALETIKSSEVNLEEIYIRFCDMNSLSRELVPSFVEAEEQIERKLCVANKVILGLYHKAMQASRRVIYVSDMYHRSAFLASLLQENGFAVGPGDLFVSSEHRVTKYDGKLFRIVVEKLGTPADQILHIGDHPISDYQGATSLGLRALLHPLRASSETPPPADNRATAALQSYRRGMSRVANRNFGDKTFYWKIGYRVYGPLLTGFCQWLGTQLREDGVKQAWFLLRDGEILKSVFETLFANDNGMPKVSTLLLSRRSLLLPILEAASAFAVPKLLYGAMTVRELFERLCLDPLLFTTEIAQCGFPSIDAAIDPQKGDQYKIFSHPVLIKALADRSVQERAALVAFLRQEGVLSTTKVAVIDVGWCGTIQTALQVLLSGEVPGAQVTGYYFGTTKLASGLRQRSYAANCGEPRQLIELLYPHSFLLECFTTTSSGSLFHFELKGKRSTPVFQPRDLSHEQRQFLAEMHQGAIAFAQEFRERSSDFRFGSLTPEIALETYLQLLTHPTAEEALRLGALQYGESMGSKKVSYLANWPSSATTVEKMWDTYENTLWKMGLIRQVNSQSASIRTLLWLNQADQ
jgi:FMN phosphatase YigB (HAD superfamily)